MRRELRDPVGARSPCRASSARLVAWLIVPMVLSLVYEVVARYFFNAPTGWAYDMTFMLYGTFFMLGSAYTLQRKGHIRTDFLLRPLVAAHAGARRPRLLPRVLLPRDGRVHVAGWDYFLALYEQGERIVTSPWMPIVWPFKFMMPLRGALLLVQGVSRSASALRSAATGSEVDAWPRRDAEGAVAY